MHIALLEDEPEQSEHVKSIMCESGHSCDAFATGQTFLSSVLHHNYDLLVLDWQIPDMTGLEVLKSVRSQINWPVPVLFLTQRDSETDIVRALDAPDQATILLERVWRFTRNINTRTVDTHMSRLRRRLGLNPDNGFRIKTIYQRGYRLEAVSQQKTESDTSKMAAQVMAIDV